VNTIDASIIIATKNRARLLDAMLGSLKKAADGTIYEVIVIEGGSSDNTLEILRSHGIAQIYDETGQLGQGRHSWSQLYNFGFSKAKGKWAMFASDDITFSERCISQAVDLLNTQADDVAGGIFFYKNVLAEPGWDDFGIDYTYGQKLLLNYGLVRLDLFRDSKGLDDLYDFYCADGDLCLKLYEQGRQFIPLPHCFVTHNNVADVQKQINVHAAQKDIDRYTGRWKHFVSTSTIPDPRRLMWRDFAAKNAPAATHCEEDKAAPCPSEKVNVMDQVRIAGLWKEGQPLRLHLGCGEQYLAGYVNIDYPQSEHHVMKIKADFYTDITKLDFPGESVDEIRLHHVFEHFSRVTALALLVRWHQWLKPGGRLFIETPDLIGTAKMLLSNAPWHYKTAAVRHITGDQADSWAYHIDQWFPERFERTLQKFGFDHIETKSVSWDHEPFLANVHATGLKARALPIDRLLQTADELLKESLVSAEEQATYEVWRSQLRKLVEAVKTDPANKPSEESALSESLKKDFRNVKALVRLAAIEIDRGNTKKAKQYLLAAKALDPKNKTALSLLRRV
jgi:GT2 family glycosyltransferase